MSGQNGKTLDLKFLTNLKWWQATIMITVILVAAGFAAHEGVNLTVNLDLQARVDAIERTLEIPVNSSLSGLQKPCSYIISKVDTYFCMQNGTTGKLDLYDRDITYVVYNAAGNITNGGLLVFAASNFTFRSSLNLSDLNNVVFYGQGSGTVFFLGAGVNSNFIQLNNCYGCRIQNLQVNGNRANNPGAYENLELINSTAFTLEDCLVTEAPRYGIRADARSDVTITRNSFSNSQNDHIALFCENGSIVSENHFYPTANVYNYVSTIGNAKGITILGNSFYNATTGQCYGVGLEYNSSDITVTGNTFIDCSNAITVYPNSATDSVNHSIISSNTILWTGEQPPKSNGGLSGFIGIQALGGYDLSILGNTITTARSASTQGLLGIYLMGTQATVSGNTICNFQNTSKGYAIQVATGSVAANNCTISDNAITNCRYGIVLSSKAYFNLFSGNSIIECANAISNGGAGNKWKNNIGFVTENSGYQTNCISGTTITHGLASTPNGYIIAISSVTGEIVTITATSSTTFTLGIIWNNGTTVDANHSPCTVYWGAEYKP